MLSSFMRALFAPTVAPNALRSLQKFPLRPKEFAGKFLGTGDEALLWLSSSMRALFAPALPKVLCTFAKACATVQRICAQIFLNREMELFLI